MIIQGFAKFLRCTSGLSRHPCISWSHHHLGLFGRYAQGTHTRPCVASQITACKLSWSCQNRPQFYLLQQSHRAFPFPQPPPAKAIIQPSRGTEGRGTDTLLVERKHWKGIGTSIESRWMVIIKVGKDHGDNKTLPRLQKSPGSMLRIFLLNPGKGPAPSAPLSGVHLP